MLQPTLARRLCGDCAPDGFACNDEDECCSGECNGGVCGEATLCPSDGSECGDCVAQACCDELIGCFGDPDCIDDVTCFVGCLGGGNPGLCFFQCLDSQAALQVAICLGSNCGPGVCF